MEGTSVRFVENTAQLRREVLEVLMDPRTRAKHNRLAVDTETNGLDPLAEGARLLLVQLGVPGRTWVINARRCDVSLLKPILEDKHWLCVLQNAKFDYKWLKVHAGIVMPRMYDTQLAELILTAGLHRVKAQRLRAASLAAMVKKYCGEDVVLEKSIRKTFIGYKGDRFTDAQLWYAAEDIPYLFTIMKAQTWQLKEGDLMPVATIEFRAVGAVGDMELNGIKLDPVKYGAVVEIARQKFAECEEELNGVLSSGKFPQRNLLGGVTINLNSTKQLREAFEVFGIVLEKTDVKTLKTIDHPFAKSLIAYRKAFKLVTVYGESVIARIHSETLRLHPEFLQLGSDAGRFSCVKPNIQQMPATPVYRSCFVAEPGHKLIKGDWSQFELRILAEFSQDAGMIAAFLAGLDMHSDTAARMYGLDYAKVVEDSKSDAGSKERQDAKILNFALAYGMGPASLAASLKCSMEEAKDKIEKWYAARPQAGEWLRLAGIQAVRYCESRTLAGRRRCFNPVQTDDYKERRKQEGAIQREGKNTPIQGSNADMLKIAMRMVADALREAGIVGRNVGLVACVHDEIVIEVPEDRAEEAAEILATCMRKAGEVYLHLVPVCSEVAIADYWKK